MKYFWRTGILKGNAVQFSFTVQLSSRQDEIWKTIITESHNRIIRDFIRDFIMSNFNKVILPLQKIKSKNLGQNQENVEHNLVKDYSFSNDEQRS